MRRFTSLRRAGAFRAVRRGRRSAQPTLVLYRSPGAAPDGRAEVGIVVSKAVGKAVVRNRVRRRLAALLHDGLAGRPPERLLVVANPPAAAAGFAALRADLHRALA